jgi:hypothetical protein
MSLGDDPGLDVNAKRRYEMFLAQADADRIARAAGHKSLFRRVRERLWPHSQAPRNGQQSCDGTFGDPGH